MAEWARDETPQKDAFAVAWLKHGDPFPAALEVFGHENGGVAILFSSLWAKDPYVLRKRQELIDERGEEGFLPSKAEIARKILAVHDAATFADEKTRALRLYAEVMGHITKDKIDDKKSAAFVLNKEDMKL